MNAWSCLRQRHKVTRSTPISSAICSCVLYSGSLRDNISFSIKRYTARCCLTSSLSANKSRLDFAIVSSPPCEINYAISLFSVRSEEHTSELQSRGHLVCRLLLEKKNIYTYVPHLVY